ncbi:MAG: hypothetical protein HQ453_13915 [Actinobacteria bacterium]|nr:hypothetical protein [Actinomycetota bacterium]
MPAANANAVKPSMAMLDSMLAMARPVAELLSDREFSHKRKGTWTNPLREHGIAQVIDMRPATATTATTTASRTAALKGVRFGVVRHEALIVRMEVEDLRLHAVVAVG